MVEKVKAGYKQTEVGVIPEDWKLISFDDAFDSCSSASYSRSDLTENGDIFYIHYGDIHTKWNYFLDFSKHTVPTIDKLKLKHYSLLKDGDLIIVDASEDYEGICKSVEVTNINKIKAFSGLHTFLFRSKKNTFVDGFKGYISSNKVVRDQYNRLATGLKVYGVSKTNIKRILIPLPPTEKLQKASNVQNKSLYEANKEVYTLLRYGADIKEKVGEHKKTVHFIDWNNRLNNDFYIAQEVTITGIHDKRPDIVLYVNGIAVAVIELKRSTISVAQDIRQNLDNQKEMFIKPFFSTIQLVMAGNDTEGLRYATIETPEKYYLSWKEKSTVKNKLDRALLQLGDKERLLEIIHDFLVFDSGTKKICRHNQYFGVRESQKYLKKRKGGIIWHTQGSGKSLTMIWLAKWIRENIPNSRVLIITDRQELDDQIERFFKGVKEDIYRTKSGKDLIKKLNTTEPWLMCSLVHKFGRKTSTDVDDFLAELRDSMPKDFKAKGDIYVFVDECHRTQSGKLHKAMTTILPKGVFVGFTGTPLLKADKRNSIKTFGKYIHTYKYDEAVNDKVVLDLQYEAREINQRLSSPEKVDQWFEAKTKGLTDVAKRELKKRWGTMQKVLSSQSRLNKIVADILLDMEKNDRLLSGRGNAILVAGSIYEACKYYELFQGHGLKKCSMEKTLIYSKRK